MTHTISKEIEFDAGHRVPLHASKCKNPHGHRYRVVAHIVGELITEGPESGMVRDFSIVKQLLTEHVHDVYDHGFIVSDKDDAMLYAFSVDGNNPLKGEVDNMNGWKVIVVPFYPTAECLAKKIFEDLRANGLPTLYQIDVWETPTSCASWSDQTTLNRQVVSDL
jgi:6-pyruvoyltetrahydropterin/6-carboxytetrahydropterin synthase